LVRCQDTGHVAIQKPALWFGDQLTLTHLILEQHENPEFLLQIDGEFMGWRSRDAFVHVRSVLTQVLLFGIKNACPGSGETYPSKDKDEDKPFCFHPFYY